MEERRFSDHGKDQASPVQGRGPIETVRFQQRSPDPGKSVLCNSTYKYSLYEVALVGITQLQKI